MTIFVHHKAQGRPSLEKKHGPDVLALDLTSKGTEPWVRFSPFFPHGEIPVPFCPGLAGQSVEGIWQGLKVFETADIDPTRFEVTTMRGLKRTVRRFGACLGHRSGTDPDAPLLGYAEARWQIYLPTYRWVLEHTLRDEVEQLRALASEPRPLVLVDYNTNCDVRDLRKPLSHAGLVKHWLDGTWPEPQGSSR